MKFDNPRRETRSENRSENKSAKPGFTTRKSVYTEVSFLIVETAMCKHSLSLQFY